jgi:hypothetical protein
VVNREDAQQLGRIWGRKEVAFIMRRTQRFFSLLAIVFMFASLALVRPARAGDDWPPVPPEDLALKDNPADPGADAMILYRESTVDVSDVMARGDSDQEYYRIKIFTQAGTKYATVEIPLPDPEGQHWYDIQRSGTLHLASVRGRTIHPDGTIVNFDGTVVTKEIAKEGEPKYLEAEFTLPDAQPGSIIEYRYNKQGDPKWFHPEKWTVSQDIFTREAHFTFIPILHPLQYHLATGERVEPVATYRAYRLPADEVPQCSVVGNGPCVMVARNIPAVVEEPVMPPKASLEAYVQWTYEKLGGPEEDSPEQYWSSMAKQWSDNLDGFLNEKSTLSKEISRIVGPGDSPEVKLRKIYARVQQIRNLDYEQSKTPGELNAENLKQNSNVADLLRHGYGHSRGINFLFVGLARAAGFEATEVCIAPRRDGLFLPEKKDATQLSYDVVWVRADAKEYYLDPASRYFPFGLLPWFKTGLPGLRVSKQGGDFVTTPDPVSSDAQLLRHADLNIGKDGAATGEVQVDFMGQEAALVRQEGWNEDETGRKKDLEDGIKRWLPADSIFELTKMANWDDTAQPLHVEGTVKIPNFSSTGGRLAAAPITLFQAQEVKWFASEKRVNSICFPFPYEELDDVTLHLPAGYKIDTVPSGQNFNRGVVSYDISTSQQADAVQVKRHLTVNGVMYPKDAYPAFRAFFGFVRTNDNSHIMFKDTEAAKNN